jgi:hypothetical protein
MHYGIYREVGVMELVALVKADSREEAVLKARSMGYGKEYRVEEEDDNG